MLHEILFALLGKTGNIIIESENRFEINPIITFLSPSEIELINKLIILGFSYKTIEKFLQDINDSFSECLSKSYPYEEGNIGFNFGKSIYIKALAYGLDEVLGEYRATILEIEKEYLKNRVFTISLLHIHMSKYFVLLPELVSLLQRIIKENIKGGQLLDLLSERNSQGNENLKEIYLILVRTCYQVFYNQLTNWVIYGKISDPYSEFFIYKVEKKEKLLKKDSKKKEFHWDSTFSLRFSMIPQTLVSMKLSEKLLFIGKAHKILRNTDKFEKPETFFEIRTYILKYLKEIEEYEPFKFHNAVEKLRSSLGEELLDLLLKKEDFMQHLSNLKAFYFLEQGLFFQIFTEESKNLMALPPKGSSESDLNVISLQNTLMRLNLEENKVFKRVSFIIKTHGFEYQNFGNIAGLKIFGDVQQKNNSFLRFEPNKNNLQTGALWYPLKQNLENGFKISFSFRFKRISGVIPNLKQGSYAYNPNSLLSTELDPLSSSQGQENVSTTSSFCLVLQNDKDISEFKKSVPKGLVDLNEYLAIKFGIHENIYSKANSLASQNDEKTRSYIKIVYFSKKNNQELVLLEQFLDQDKANFNDEDIISFNVHYDNENIEVFFSESLTGETMDLENSLEGNMNSSSTNRMKIPLKISKLLSLEMGKGYVGFLQDSKNGLYTIDFLNWKMLGYNILNNDDPWNGLSVFYQVDWPLNLIISSTVLEKYTNVFRFLFPIRTVQLDLQKVWMNLMQKNRKSILSKETKAIIMLRNEMSLIIENLWSYFHLDVFHVQWSKLKERLAEIKDFDEMRRGLDEYLNSITNQLFLHYPKIIKSVFEIINIAKIFVNILLRLEFGGDVAVILKECEKIRVKFEDNFLKLLNLLALLNKNFNSPSLYQLLLRLDYNNFYLNPQNQ